MWKIQISVIALACAMLTGCFDIQGVHVLHYAGDNDTGSYRIRMNSITYGLLTSDSQYSTMMRDLKAWSRPTVRRDGDFVYLEDNSGGASMEHFYQTYTCEAAPVRGYEDCHFAFAIPNNMAKLPNWSVDWEVVVQPGMRVLSSNNQRVRHENGRDRLIWYFDGARDWAGSVDFTVRTPRAN